MSSSGNPHTVTALSAQIQASLLGRTLSGIVRSELATIETALQHGVRYEQLCQHLAALGIKVSAGTLRQTVYRLRCEQRRLAGRQVERPAAGLAAPQASKAPDDERPVGAPSTEASPSAMGRPTRMESATARPGSADRIPATSSDTTELPLTAHSDGIPLLSGRPATPLGARGRVDFISEIRESYPDLDLLADRYRKSLQRERQTTPAADNAMGSLTHAAANLTSTPSPTGSTPS